MPRGKMYYVVRKQFISGLLAGMTFNDETTVSGFVPGRVYKSAAPSGSSYLVLSVQPMYPL